MSSLRNRKKGSAAHPSPNLTEGASQKPASTAPSETTEQTSSSSNKKIYLWVSLFFLCVAVYLAILYTNTANTSLESSTTTSSSSRKLSSLEQEMFQGKRCSVYMAPSSVKGIEGYGVYTTRPLPKGSHILKGPDGPGLPVVDFSEEHNNDHVPRQQFIQLFDGYWWARGVPDHVTFEANEVIDFQITFGSLPNHHCVLESLDVHWPQPAYDDSLVASHEPGAGAFSYHMGRDFLVSRSLEAGDEILLNYGHCDDDDDGPDWAEHIPKTDDFEAAALATRSIWDQLAKQFQSSHDPKRKQELETKFDSLYKLASDLVTEKASKLLPDTLDGLAKVMFSIKKKNHDKLIRTIAKEMGTTPRTVDWIVENGLCVENLVLGPSRIPQAGHGGIAQYPIAKGEMVVPAPLLHIADKDVLAIYDDDGRRTGTQLLINYCFGHNESSLLLCPNTNAILINHCSTRKGQCGPEGPNAEYRWASGWDKDSDKWLEMSIDQIAASRQRGLAMEIIATRDIQPGDEVFIDYGKGWEDAWEHHVSAWSPVMREDDAEPRVSIRELNDNTGPLEFLVTGDLRVASEHPTIFTGCAFWKHGWNEEDDEEEEEENEEEEEENEDEEGELGWTKLSDDEILDEYGANGSRYVIDYATHFENAYHPCSVALREDESGSTYIVRIHTKGKSRPLFLTNYPRSSVRYFKHSYAGDQHLPGVFRHPIEIRDDIFPKQWRNRK